MAWTVMWWLLPFLAVCCCAPVPETFNVSVPDGPLTVWVGSSVTLPSFLTPAFTESLEVRWHRPDKHKTPVLLYQKQQIQEQPVDPQYRGRVSLIGELEKGDVSLKLENVTLADSGEFVCFVAGKKWYEEARVNLIVKAPSVMGNPPVLSITNGGSGQVNVTCASEGWLPQPTLTWRNRAGTEIPSQSYHSATDAQGFVSVTSWLLHSSSNSEWLSCSVELSEQEGKESRILLYIAGTDTAQIEEKKTASESEVERSKQESTGPWKNIFICFLVLLLLAFIVLAVLYKKGFIKCTDSREAVSKQDKSHATEEETESLVKKQDEEVKTLKRENIGLQNKQDESKTEVETLTKEKEDLQNKLDESKRNVETLTKEKEDLQNKLDESKRNVETLTKEKEVSKQDKSHASEEETEKLVKQVEVMTLKEKNTDLQKELNECQEKVGGLKSQIEDWRQNGLKGIKGFKESPTMDEASIHGHLRIVRGGKRVHNLKANKSPTPDTLPYVLCKDTLSEGQHYWEIRVSKKQSWFVGVCTDTFREHGKVPELTPLNGCWLLRYDKDSGLLANTHQPTPVYIIKPVNILGVFLDCCGHQLFFYDVDSESHLYTFHDMNPTSPVVPVLSPGEKDLEALEIL